MNKPLITHSLWLAAALAAYTAGATRSPRPASASEGARTLVTVPTPPPPGSSTQGTPDPNGAATTTDSLADSQSPKSRQPLSDSEIEPVAREAFTDPNPLKRQLAFARLLDGLTPENAQSIRQQMRGGRANGDQWRLFQYAWGAADGPGALAAASALENKDYRTGATASAITGWASTDPQKAIAWLAGVGDQDERNRLQDSLVGGLADHDIGVATRYVMDLAATGDARAAAHMETVASEQIRKAGPEGAARWAESLIAGDAKAAALDRVANTYVASNPEAAAAWAAQFATSDYGARVIEEVGDEWAEKNPVAAVKWLQNLADGRGKSDGMYSALGEWARHDPTAASQYLVDMPPSALKDTAVNGFVRRLAWEDPESALAWAGTIAQDAPRTEAMTRAAQAWFLSNREAAIQWLPTSGLSAEAQQKVLETKPGDRRRRG